MGDWANERRCIGARGKDADYMVATNRPSSVHTMDHSHPFPSAAATPSGPTVPSRSVPRYIDARQFHARNRLVDVAFSERRAERRDAPPLRTQTRLVRCTFNEYTHTWLPPSPGGCCYYWPPFSRMDRFDGYESSRVFAQGSFFPFLFFLFIRFVELLFFFFLFLELRAIRYPSGDYLFFFYFGFYSFESFWGREELCQIYFSFGR